MKVTSLREAFASQGIVVPAGRYGGTLWSHFRPDDSALLITLWRHQYNPNQVKLFERRPSMTMFHKQHEKEVRRAIFHSIPIYGFITVAKVPDTVPHVIKEVLIDRLHRIGVVSVSKDAIYGRVYTD